MIPVVIMSGFCTALGRIIGQTEVKGTPGFYLLTAGNGGFSIMVAILAAGIGYSIAGKQRLHQGCWEVGYQHRLMLVFLEEL